ncbi:35307_t:CDS:2 [Gigaspora margarita]|uniref:35307_t:CDS:1 n=1 Tax=Gigaspora margarita TaxID=4874 RepID=A0ABN7UIW0_GIGMA|nr:35307_t:CDS:2 [Gigaspora margarita]
MKEFKQLLKLTTNIAKYKNIKSNVYKMDIEFIESFLVIIETYFFKEKMYKKDHIFYSVGKDKKRLFLASSKQASNTVIPALPLALNTKSGNIGIPLSVLDMTSSAPVESKQTMSSHALKLSLPTPSTRQQGTQPQYRSSYTCPGINNYKLGKESESMEVDLNLDIASAISTIELDSLPKTYSQVVSSSQTPQ